MYVCVGVCTVDKNVYHQFVSEYCSVFLFLSLILSLFLSPSIHERKKYEELINGVVV